MRSTLRRRLAALVFAIACAAMPAGADPQGAAPSELSRGSLGEGLPTFDAPADPTSSTVPNAVDPAGVLDLRDALAAALLGSPDLAAGSYEIRARESAALQAGLRPSPDAELEVEDFVGTGEYRGLRSSQTTLRLGQLVELGGKRAARLRLAERERDLAAFDWEIARLDVLTRTTIAFVDVVQAQEELRVTEENVRAARDLVSAADERQRAGAGAPDDALRFRVTRGAAELEHARALRALEVARLRLATGWGGGVARFDRADADLSQTVETPPLAALRTRIATSPDLARWESELSARADRVALERSRAVPDVRIAAGPRYYASPNDGAFVLDASIPLPLWNRNQGAIAEARHRLAKAGAQRRAEEVRLATELAAAHTTADAARAEAELMQRDTLPQAEASYTAVRSAYRAGRLGATDVLEAQRIRLALRAQRLRALGEYHRSVAAIERVLGAPLTPSASTSPEGDVLKGKSR